MPAGSYVVQAATYGYAPSEVNVEVPRGASGPVTANVSLGRGAKMTGRLVKGDGIVRIVGRPVVELGFTDAIQSIRGAEGSKLVLGVRRASAPGTEGNPAPIVDITVTRRRVRR